MSGFGGLIPNGSCPVRGYRCVPRYEGVDLAEPLGTRLSHDEVGGAIDLDGGGDAHGCSFRPSLQAWKVVLQHCDAVLAIKDKQSTCPSFGDEQASVSQWRQPTWRG